MLRYVKNSLCKLLQDDQARETSPPRPRINAQDNEEEGRAATPPTTPWRENDAVTRIKKRRTHNGHRALAAVADLQGFWIDGQFVIKVLTAIRAVQGESEQCVQKFTFRPPRPFHTLNRDDKRHVWWIKRCHHATPPWSNGRYDYGDRTFVMMKAFEGVSTIYVKGGQKKEWLQEVLQGKDIFDLESFGCPPLHECLRKYRELYACGDVSLAGQHVIALYEWMIVHRPDLLHHDVVEREM
ncbi:hypothetical protein R5R35_011993 [Gryllus longicercus]|uniref:Uncharacterized protein n=1 Tax=Gryllus longicercus TaxID=2509291 RepID=A0AAN9ZD13_9ORTH